MNLIDKCHINSNQDGDTFVGIQGTNEDLKVCFPLGYRLEKNDKNVRKDIINLISVLANFTDKKDKLIPENTRVLNKAVEFPIVAYMKIIINFLNSGYYYENEMRYKVDKRGKINWARTIKTQKTYQQGNEVFYLDYVVKQNTINQDEMISLIHEYCVYESFQKLGWLYTTRLSKKPKIRFNKKIFLSVIYEKMGQTFNDKSKALFQNMIDMITYIGSEGSSERFYYGTYRFEYVWERMIDRVFGVDDKERYFPRTKWHLIGGKNKGNSALEPDTIMASGNSIYVLDAKYYKYGATGIPGHLPESTSINKQITYGEYIATTKIFKQEYGPDMKVYNAFVMPFSKEFKYFATNDNYKYIGEATGDWKELVGAEYEHVQGILLDVKYIMYNHIKADGDQINILSEMIVSSNLNVTS